MKSFYEMCRILEGYDYDSWLGKPYQDDLERERSVSFSRVLGEGDDEAPFSIEVDYYDGEWSPGGSLFVRGDEGGESKWEEYKNPGKNLMGVPEPVRGRALAWINAEIERLVANYEPEDPRDHYDGPRGREWDDDDQDRYDRQVWLGGEKW